MGNTSKKILQFPAPHEEPSAATVFFQIGSTRFAIHWSIEEPPPAEPPLRLVPKATKTTNGLYSPESFGAKPEYFKP